VARAESQGDGTNGGRDGRARRSTRQRILASSLEFFAANGFEGTDIVDIERAVGLRPGSGGFYRHFRNKEDVLRAVIEDEIERVRQHQTALTRIPTRTEPGHEVADRVERLLDMLWEMRHLMAVISHENARFPDLLPQIASAMADSGVEIGAADLSRLMDQGDVPRRPPEAVASIVLMAGVGFTLTCRLFGRPIAHVEREQFGRVLTDLVTGHAET
jgi:AcrR family transcriptional regulator